MPDRHTDEELARIMRAGLAARAAQAPDRLSRRPGATRSGPRLWPLAAAASVVLLLAVPLAVRWAGTGERPPGQGPGVLDSPAASPVPADWRVESYGGIQVRVPPEWGWGGAPFTSEWSGSKPLGCGATTAFVVPGSDTYESVDHSTPFVGRPAMMTDACEGYDLRFTTPHVDAVWLDSPIETGTATYEAGMVGETIAVGGRRITVFSRDDSLRRRIIGTAEAFGHQDGNGCPATGVSDAEPAPGGAFEPTSLSVCVYGDLEGERVLVWSGRRSAAQARAYVDAFARAAAPDPHPCREPDGGQWVALGVHGAGGGEESRWDVVRFACGRIESAGPTVAGERATATAPLEVATVEPWAGGGVLAYAWGGGKIGGDLSRFFRPTMG